MQIKNILKHNRNNLAYRIDFITQLHYLLAVVFVSDISLVKVTLTIT